MNDHDVRRPGRRAFLALTAAVVSGAAGGVGTLFPRGALEMYGLIGKMTTKPGQRDALIAILIDGVASMPGCLSYIVAKDTADPDGIWITEVWDSKASHDASLSLPAVREAIAKGRPLIAGFAASYTTAPVGGHGLIVPKSTEGERR